MTMLGELYRDATRAAKFPPASWPAPALVVWATDALRAAVSPVESDEDLALAWTHWAGPRQPCGERKKGPLFSLYAYLEWLADDRRTAKLDAPCWGPATYGPHPETAAPNYRNQATAEQITALVLDCDDQGDWLALLDVLDREGLAFVAYRTPSHCDGGPFKWRLVLPLSAPVQGAGLLRWPATYTAARVAFAALGACWFDSTCGETARCFYGPVAIGDAPRRDVLWHGGKALDLSALVAAAPKVLPLPKIEMPARAATTAIGGELDYRTFDVLQWARDCGLYLAQAPKGDGKHYLTCPWQSSHTGGLQGPTDTMLFAGPPAGFWCNHSSCTGTRTIDHVRDLVGAADLARYCERRESPGAYWSGKLWRRCLAANADPAAVAWLQGHKLDPDKVAALDLVRVLPATLVDLPRWASCKGKPWTADAPRLVVRAWEADPDNPGRLRLARLHALALSSGELSAPLPGLVWATSPDPRTDGLHKLELCEGLATWLRLALEQATMPLGARPAVWGVAGSDADPAAAAVVPEGWKVKVRAAPATVAKWCNLLAPRCKVLAKQSVTPQPAAAIHLAHPADPPCPPPATADPVAIACEAVRDADGPEALAMVWAGCCRQWGGADLVPAAVAGELRERHDYMGGWDMTAYYAKLRELGAK